MRRIRPLLALVAWVACSTLFAAFVHASALADYDFDRGDRLSSADAYRPWHNLMQRHAAERALLDACRSDESQCPRYLRGYRHVMEAAPALSRNEQLLLVDRFVDRREWRIEHLRDDEWRSLTAFLRDGGDCEDFAIAKYFILRDLGFTADELRVVVAQEAHSNRQHALLAVRLGSVVKLFDSDNHIYTPRSHWNYDFIYSINETALWDHASPAAASRPGALQSATGAQE